MNAVRDDIEFLSQSAKCRAWRYTPSAAVDSPRRACIVMAHGLGGTRSAGLDPYARRFAAAGYSVLVFDYRHFGDSEGLPRQLVSIGGQLQDWSAAIACARSLPGVDPEKIVLWGSSFSGGYVVVAAARDAKVAAICAQCPMMDGLSATINIMSYAGIGTALKLVARGLHDVGRAALALSPVHVALVATPGQLATMSTADAEPGYRAIVQADWRNEICARFALVLALFRPIRFARRVHCPALIQVCLRDSVAPAQSAIKTARRIGKLAELEQYDLGHFDIYIGEPFERACAAQLAFLGRVLEPSAPVRGPNVQASNQIAPLGHARPKPGLDWHEAR